MTKLAWRNIWRNRRRTAITLASIAFGLAAILFVQSLIKTIQLQLIEKATGVFTGHVQVVAKGVDDYKLPDKNIKDIARVEKAAAALPGVVEYGKRLHITGLASSDSDSAGVLLCGVEPGKERRITSMHSYKTQGEYLRDPSAPEAYIGAKLAEQLGVGLGGDLVLMASASDGSIGAERFRIVGVFQTGSHTFDAQLVYVPLAPLQGMLALEGRINNLIVRLADPQRIYEARAELAAGLSDLPVEAVTWEQIDHELVGIRRYQNALLSIVLAVVFAIVALGVANTLLMSMFERLREFGVLRALGARPSFIVRTVLLESFLLCLCGTALGVALGAGAIFYYRRAGLVLPLKDAVSYFMPFDTVLYLRFNWPMHIAALASVLLTSLLAGLPPALKAAKLKPTEALRYL